jgi:hypothetical protein
VASTSKSNRKRKLSNTSIVSINDTDSDDDVKIIKIDQNEITKPKCKYGQDCYRKNPDHLNEFSHLNGNLKISNLKN